MRVIPPINTDGFTIADAMLSSTTAAEPGTGEVAWNSATAYAIGDQVYLASTHRRYEARTAHTNKNPALATIDTPSADWQDIGPTNRWAMFDTLRQTGTIFTSPGVVEVEPGTRIDSVGVAGLENVDTVLIEVIRGVDTVYSRTLTMRYRHVSTFYEFCFAPFNVRTESAVFNIPPYTDATVRLTFTRAAGGELSVGAVIMGMNEYIGQAQHGAEDDALNFSRIERDFDSSLKLTRRRNVPKNALSLVLDKGRVARVRQVRDTLNAVPAIYVGLDNDQDGYYASLFKLGIYRRWSINLDNPRHAIVSLEVEET